MDDQDELRIGIAQISPVWLNKKLTIEKIESYIIKAADAECDIVCFGEALLPGYPFWLSLTNAAKFNSKIQKEIHSHYLKQAIRISVGDLASICELAKTKEISVVLGTIELGENRGSHSVYCTAVYINKLGEIKSTHRKLMPTYEERLSWAQGDGNGLRVHPLKEFSLGILNCWENWMPLPRAALYAQGENLHFSLWPGSWHNTNDITRFIAKESRSFCVSVSGLMNLDSITQEIPYGDFIKSQAKDLKVNGGSCVAAPNGEWLMEPQLDKEDLFVVDINHNLVREERQNFDPSGHYSRPDITQLSVDRRRQSIVDFKD